MRSRNPTYHRADPNACAHDRIFGAGPDRRVAIVFIAPPDRQIRRDKEQRGQPRHCHRTTPQVRTSMSNVCVVGGALPCMHVCVTA